MSGFNNPVVGALKLIRRAIQSPNYQAGAVGWTINDDGSAEFNALTVRGKIVVQSGTQGVFVYSGTPAHGNLIASIASAAGTDPYGNVYSAGILSYASGTTAVQINGGEVDFTDPTYAGSNATIGAAPQQAPGDSPYLYVSSPSNNQANDAYSRIHLYGQSSDGTKGQFIKLTGFSIPAGETPTPVLINGTLSVSGNSGAVSAMATQPGYGTAGSFVEFTGAQWAALQVVCPPSETIEIVSRMQGYNNTSTGSTLAIAPKVKAGATTLVQPDARQGCYTTIQSTTLTNNLHAVGSAIIGQDVLGGRAGQTLTIVPCWRITSGSASTVNLANAAMTVKPLLYSVPISSL